MAGSATAARRGMSPVVAASLAGASWGLGGYLALWGYTPLTVHRSFVVSAMGTIALLPIRVVLWAIRFVEERVGHPFEFASRNEWIGLAAAVAGAAISLPLFVAARALIRRVRVAGSPR